MQHEVRTIAIGFQMSSVLREAPHEHVCSVLACAYDIATGGH
jgi:hypothetical protein